MTPCSAEQVLEVVAEPTAPRLDYVALLGGIPSEITQVDKLAQRKEAERLKVEQEQAQEQVGPCFVALHLFWAWGRKQQLSKWILLLRPQVCGGHRSGSTRAPPERSTTSACSISCGSMSHWGMVLAARTWARGGLLVGTVATAAADLC